MFKIKLLILLLASLLIFSCSNKKINNSYQKYSLAYIGGEYDGLLLKNYLISSLKNLNLYDQNSIYEIQANLNHTSNLFITNIDNTSDREKIDSELNVKIINKLNKCIIYNDNISISQFYIYAPSNKYLSNQKAEKKIKRDNTETLVKKFINKIINFENKCND